MTDQSGVDPTAAAVNPAVTPAQAEAAQPASNARALTGGEQLAKATAEAAVPQTPGLNLFQAARNVFQPLPQVYDAFTRARSAGYSWDEINSGFQSAKAEAVKQGYTPAEVNAAVGLPNLDDTPAPPGGKPVLPPPSAFEQNGIPGQFAGLIRDVASKYLSPRDPSQAALDFKPTAGGIAADLGYNIVDVGKMFGAGVANGLAATAELLDGRQGRTLGDWASLGWEASGFLGLFLPGPKGETAAAKGEANMVHGLPSREDMLDGATALSKAAGDLETPGAITDHARVLGDNFVKTGEDPIAAAQRAQANPDVMADFNARAEAARRVREGGPNLEAGQPPEAPVTGLLRNAAGDQARAEIEASARSAAAGDLEQATAHIDAPGRFSRLAEEQANGEAGSGLAGRVAGDTPGAVPESVGHVGESYADTLEGGAGAAGGPADAIRGFLESQSGAVPMLSYPKIDPQTIRVQNPKLADGLIDDIQRIFAPATRAPIEAGVIRAGLARNEVTVLQASNNLRKFGRAVGELPSTERQAWFRAYQSGDMSELAGIHNEAPLTAMAKEIHRTFDGLYDRMEKLGIAPDYVENYIPQLWQDPQAAKSFFTGRRPLEGNKAFTRARFYNTIQEGMDAGLKLVTDDPVELSLLQVQQQSKFITAHEIAQELIERGVATPVVKEWNGRVPDGLVPVNLPKGITYAPEPVATLLNRYLSPGLSGRPAYDTLRTMTTASTSMQLLGSVFHPVLLGWDAIAGQMGLGIKQIERGVRGGAPLDIGRGLANIGTSPAAPFINAYKGNRYLSEIINGPGADPFRTTVADAMISAGARALPPSTYQVTASGSFLRVLRGSLNPAGGGRTFGQEAVQMFRDAAPIQIGDRQIAPAYVRAMGQIAGRALDTVSSPIMEVMVPHLKVGAIASELEDMLRAHPGMGEDDIRAAGGKIVDQVDRRLGQMTYDHLFWNKSLMDVNQVLFRAPGWVLGKLQLMGSAGLDALKGGYVDVGDEKELSSNLTYLVGTLGATAMTGATYGYLKGQWNKDWGWKDYLFPAGMSLPSIMRDMYGWLTDPAQEGKNKINSLWPTIGDLATNRDFRGAAIADPRSPWLEQSEDYLDFTAKQFAPMITNTPSTTGQELSPFERWLGIRPAPYAVREPGREEKFQRNEERTALHKRAKERQQQ